MKKFLLLILFFLKLNANFSDEYYEFAKKYNQNLNNFDENLTNYKDFESLIFSLPKDAKFIKNITISYVDFDGKNSEKTIKIFKNLKNNSFIVSQNEQPQISDIFDVSVSFKPKNLLNFDENLTLTKNKIIQLPLKIIEIDKNLRISVWDKNLKILTNLDINETKNSKNILEFLIKNDQNISFGRYLLNTDKFLDLNISQKQNFTNIKIGLKDQNVTILKEKNGIKIFY